MDGFGCDWLEWLEMVIPMLIKMTMMMVKNTMGWPYDSFDCIVFCFFTFTQSTIQHTKLASIFFLVFIFSNFDHITHIQNIFF